MLSGKAAAASRPTALGSLLQAATYGQTIPTIYGMTQSPLLAIWAANLRQGGGNVKKFKQLKKGVTNYEENIDFLLGHNPILGVMQMWNNGTPFPLALASTTGGAVPSITISDPHFYAVIGVSIEASYSVSFDDYGGVPQTLTGTYQIPMWNELLNGPDPVHNSGYRNYPYCYRWEPSYGPEIFIDSASGPIVGTVTIYYYQLKSATSFLPPIQKLFLTFEPELGDGPQYADANLSAQQIIYPMFAGLGSPNINLGAGGVIPALQAEVQGKFSLYSTGDGDFADMIEDVFKSGVAQAAIGATDTGAPGTTQVEHGLSAYQFPGTVQMKCENSVEAFELGPLSYNLPVTAGNFLVVIATSGTTLGISDTAANTWTPVFGSGLGYQAWYVQAPASGPDTVTVTGQTDGWTTTLIEIGGVDTFDSVSIGSGTTASITTTNQQNFPEYLLALGIYEFDLAPDVTIPLWNLLTPANTYGLRPNPAVMIQDRILNSPGTYPITVSAVGLGAICILGFKCINPPSYPDPVGDFLDFASLDQVRLQCRAGGLWGSLSMNSQQSASDWLKVLYQAADAAPVFMGFKLFSFPYSEVSAVGNGVVYNAPTASGPVANLSTENGDFVTASSSAAPIQIKTAARVNQPNVLQMQCINRASNYNPSVVEQPDAAGISLFGIRKADPVVNNAVQDVSIARQILGIMVRKLQYGGDVYSFSLPAKWCLLAPMDLITITDPLADIYQIPVRLTSLAEQNNGSLQCTAEAFVYGMYSPVPFSATAPLPYTPNTIATAGNVNPPIIFEPTPALEGLSNQPELWVVVSSNNPNFGTAQVYVSTDLGSSYVPLGNPVVGSATTGYLRADWPAALCPDTTNNLPLDLTESDGVIESYPVMTEDGLVYPCYVAGGVGYQPGHIILSSTGSTSLGGAMSAGLFGQFSLPELPWDAVITGIYPVLNSGASAIATTFASYGPYADFAPGSAGPFAGGIQFPGFPAGSGDVYGTSLGIDPSVLPVQGISVSALRSDSNPTSPDQWPVNACAYAIYYTSATPLIDPTIAAPFTVPSGSGVAWSLPYNLMFLFSGLGTISGQSVTLALGIEYELMTYGIATLDATFKYTLQATGGNHLNRSVLGAPNPTIPPTVGGQGVDHPSGSRWAFLNPSGQGILKASLPSTWIGHTLFFKIVSANTFGTATQSLSEVPAYTYVPQGQTGSAVTSQMYVNDPQFDLTQPTSTTITMAQTAVTFAVDNLVNYNARTFTISTPGSPTWYYVTIADPTEVGDSGASTNLTATCQTSDALVGVPGNTYMGAILALTAGSAIQVIPGGWPAPAAIQVGS